ncbi:hypothetical protein DGG96_16995 [Legionella qingyii]|uniref:Uncharacterized protein n=1 Tax=Legionella qingyii TaxID=2184757 RepID=A0A317TZT6_9GAMM|nr:hypothetical protein [Legionella qingyii]PWY54117.1 hypothetical protein DGG96_18595 [Legionella qingyii]PWY54465.1 hypothetical protein DGG96_16995 [Legionella qingyii]RUR21107.1 hypothetical protein ELY20_13420 [Legionella qingyii]
MNIGICRLCNQKGELRESHIVPKLIFRWLIRTSATSYLRFGTQINKRVQDGLKLYWLCSDCECKLCTWETYFSNKIFRPLRHVDHVSYNNNFLKFAVSLSWRVLKYFQELGGLNDFDDKIVKASDQALLNWKEFLFNNNKNPGGYEQHLYNFIGEVSSAHSELPVNINRYLQRSVEIDVQASKNIAFVYTKLPGLLCIGYIKLNDSKPWRKTRICVHNGRIEPMEYSIPLELWDIIKQKAEESQVLQKSISEKQQDKIKQDYLDNIQEANKSGTIEALSKDINLFGIDLVFGKK